jgi:glycosyltransferase involved in cell wall biosynthesis
MGRHSGYDQLCDEISKIEPGNYRSVWRKQKSRPRYGIDYLLRLVAGRIKASPFYNLNSTAAEIKTLWKSLIQHPDLIHITYVENQSGILTNWSQLFSFKILGTIHQPASWWRLRYGHPEILRLFHALIVLGRKEVTYFEKYCAGKVYFLPHGVDTDFFSPAQQIGRSNNSYPRCVFVGRWLRDVESLVQIIDKLVTKNPQIRYDMVVPHKDRNNSLYYRIARHEQVFWYDGISDVQLRNIYQQGSLLLLPLIDSVANTSIVEAVACGLPVISNDVGGVPDYTNKAFADLFPTGDIEGMANAVLSLVDDAEEQRKRREAARAFAEENLSWKKIAGQTFKIYQKVISDHS